MPLLPGLLPGGGQLAPRVRPQCTPVPRAGTPGARQDKPEFVPKCSEWTKGTHPQSIPTQTVPSSHSLLSLGSLVAPTASHRCLKRSWYRQWQQGRRRQTSLSPELTVVLPLSSSQKGRRKSAHRAEPLSPQFPLPPVPVHPHPSWQPRGPWVGREKLACTEPRTATTPATCTVPSRLFNDSNAWGP